jgi:hypothetical protein
MTVKPLRELQKPSGASTVSKAKSGKSFTESPQPVTKGTTKHSAKHGHSIDNYEHHSWHREQVSKHYHKEIATNTKTDTGQFGDRKIAKLNPTSAGPQITAYPGLAN